MATLILEPEPKTDSRPEQRYRLMLRVSCGLEHVADGLTNRQAWGLAGCGLGLATPEVLGVPEKPER